MRQLASSVLLVTALFGLASCSLDLEVPAKKLAGGLQGIIDTQGHVPAEGLVVRLINSRTNERFEVTTGAGGAFVRSELSASQYLVQADVPGFAPIREGPFELTAGQALDVGTIKPTWLAQTTSEGTLSGRVLVRGGSTGSDDAGASGRPSDAQGAKIECLLEGTNGTVVGTTVVDAFGDFSIRLPPGMFTLRVTHPYYVASVRQGIMLGEGEKRDLSSQPLVMELNPAEISGNVQRELDGQSTTEPAEGAIVVADTGVVATVDALGNFKLTNLAAGHRTWSITLPRHVDPMQTRSADLAAGEKRTVEALTLRLIRSALSGDVEMADNSPLDQVTVSIPGSTYSVQAAPSSTSPHRGRFVLSGVPLGSYSVRASRPSYIAATSTVVNLTTSAPVDVGTLRLTRVQGDFIVDDGDPNNLAGYARQPDVTLRLSNVMSAAEYRKAEDSSALASQPWSPVVGTSPIIAHTLSSGDGLKTIYLQFRDAQNNESSPLSGSVFLDTTPPSNALLELANGQDFTNRSNPIAVTLTADETGSGIALMHVTSAANPDGGELLGLRQTWLKDTSYTRPGLTDGGPPQEGHEVVYAQVIDNAGNASAVVSDDVVIDTTNPIGSLVVLRGSKATVDGYTHTPLVELNESTTPEPFGGGLKVRLANDVLDLATAVLRPAKVRESWALDPVGEGLKTVHYQFVDSAGNVSAPGQAAISLDTKAPVVTVTLQSPSATNSQTVTVLVTSTDASPLSPTEGLTLSESALFSGATPTAFPPTGVASTVVSSGDGQKNVFVRVRDAAGNDATDDTTRVSLDQTAPQGVALNLTGTLGDGSTSPTRTSTASVTVTLTHTGATRVRLGNETQTDCATGGAYSAITSNTIASVALTGGSGSTRTVTACFIDEAQNRAGPVSATIQLDTAAPSGCSLVMTGRRADDGTAVPSVLDKTALKDVTWVLAGCSEVPAEIVLTEATLPCNASTLGFTPHAGGTGTLTLSGIDGLKTVRGCARDLTRNIASIAADSLTLDTSPPQSPTLLLDSGAAFVNLAQKTSRGGTNRVSALGSATGAERWALAENATPSSFATFTGAAQNFDFSAGDGVKTLAALFMDDVGNITQTSALDSIEFDTVAPTFTALRLTGTLADGTASETWTASTNVTAELVQAGATGVIFGDASLTSCPTSGYGVYSGGSISAALPGAGTVRTVNACVTDQAGNPTGPVTDVINFDSVAPTGCALALVGFNRVDGGTTSGPLADRTALPGVKVTLNGCVEVPTQIYLTEGTVSCSNASVLDWRTYDVNSSFTLSFGDGPKNVSGCMRDQSLNVNAIVADAITLDTTGPSAPYLDIDDGGIYVNQAQVTARGGLFASVVGTASGATEWAIGLSPDPAGFVSITTNPIPSFALGGGEGTRFVYASFRDDLGNVSTAVDTITVDTIAPPLAGVTASVVGPTQNEYTNTELVQVQLTTPAGVANTVKVAQAADAGTCATTDMALSNPLPVVSAYPLTLSSTEGLKRACVQLFDSAGNVSAFVADTVTLDKTPPSTPQITTPESFVRVASGGTFTVTTSGAVTEPAASFSRYEKLGGLVSTWTSVSAVQSTTSFVFNLLNNGAEDGIRNELKLRAVDLAGNTSGESVVFITADTNAPDQIPALKDEYVDNGDLRATLHWAPSPTGAAGYLLEYGPSNSVFNGSGSPEGISPIDVDTRLYFTLTGLQNAVATWVRVSPYDRAGNVGTPSTAVRMRPEVVSPNFIGSLPLTPSSNQAVNQLLVSGHYLYLVGSNGSCDYTLPSTCGGTLRVYDLSALQSPIQTGSLNLDAGQASATMATMFFANDSQLATNQLTGAAGLFSNDSMLFMASGRYLRIFSLRNPGAPTMLTELDISSLNSEYRVDAVPGMYGSKVVVTGRRAIDRAGIILVVDVSTLFDDLPTRPTMADVQLLGVDLSFTAGSGALMRDFAMLPVGAGNAWSSPLADALDNSAATVWAADAGDLRVITGLASGVAGPAQPSGNLLMTFFNDEVGIHDYATMFAGGTTATFVNRVIQRSVTGFNMTGSQLMVTGADETGIYDLRTLFSIPRVGGSATNQAKKVTSWGTYNFVVDESNSTALRLIEVATPRALHNGASLGATSAVSGGLNVGAGLVYGSGGTVYDLLAAVPKAYAPGGVVECEMSTAWFGTDFSIGAHGNNLSVWRLDAMSDRNLATNPTVADHQLVPLPLTSRTTGTASWGSHVVVAEVRDAGVNDGVWLEVFDARKALDRNPATTFSSSDSVMSMFVGAHAGYGKAFPDVTMTSGRAVITVYDIDYSDSHASEVHIVDLRALFDDDSSTVFDVTAAKQGSFTNATLNFATVVQGNYAYSATSDGLRVTDITPAMDDDPLTKIGPSPASVVGGNYATAIKVYGTRVFTASQGSALSFDVSNPMAPRFLSETWFDAAASGPCIPNYQVSNFIPVGIGAAGSHVYVNTTYGLRTLDVE